MVHLPAGACCAPQVMLCMPGHAVHGRSCCAYQVMLCCTSHAQCPAMLQQPDSHCLLCLQKPPSAAINRKKAAQATTAENFAIFKRLQAVRPSPDMRRDNLARQAQEARKYERNRRWVLVQ